MIKIIEKEKRDRQTEIANATKKLLTRSEEPGISGQTGQLRSENVVNSCRVVSPR